MAAISSLLEPGVPNVPISQGSVKQELQELRELQAVALELQQVEPILIEVDDDDAIADDATASRQPARCKKEIVEMQDVPKHVEIGQRATMKSEIESPMKAVKSEQDLETPMKQVKRPIDRSNVQFLAAEAVGSLGKSIVTASTSTASVASTASVSAASAASAPMADEHIAAMLRAGTSPADVLRMGVCHLRLWNFVQGNDLEGLPSLKGNWHGKRQADAKEDATACKYCKHKWEKGEFAITVPRTDYALVCSCCDSAGRTFRPQRRSEGAIAAMSKADLEQFLAISAEKRARKAQRMESAKAKKDEANQPGPKRRKN